MKPYHLFILLCLSHAGMAQAEIYKRVDAQGHVTYSSEPLKGSKKLELKPLPTTPGMRASQRSTPDDFPKVDTQTQKSRDVARRAILEDELASEEKLLATALENLKSIESNPEPLIDAQGIPFRNAAKQAAKVKAAQETIAAHEQNIKALKTEISNLK
jgi:Domain of unknown function (DUF4124)